MGFDLFRQTALGISPLLAVCADAKMHAELSRGVAADESEEGGEKRDVQILQLLLQHCETLDLQAADKQAVSLLPPPHQLSSQLQTGDSRKKVEGKETREEESKKQGLLSFRRLLLEARTHKLLGSSSALHLAASGGKARVCRQLLAAGAPLGAPNAELATPLHLACIAGDQQTVKVLADRGSNLDALTERGETPLMMAAYNLHAEVCAELLERGAAADLISKVEGLSVLHAAAAGVLRQVSVQFRELTWEVDDGLALALSGFSSEARKLCIYTKANSYIVQKAMVDLRLPSATPISADCFLFPEVLIQRAVRGQQVLLHLLSHCPSELYTHKSRRGLSPAELLLGMWDAFAARRRDFLHVSDLQLHGQTEEERTEAAANWEFVLHQIQLLKDMLTPPRRLSSTDRKCTGTPRGQDLERRNREELLAEAPWLFPDLVRQSKTNAKAAAQGVAAAALESQQQAAATSSSLLPVSAPQTTSGGGPPARSNELQGASSKADSKSSQQPVGGPPAAQGPSPGGPTPPSASEEKVPPPSGKAAFLSGTGGPPAAPAKGPPPPGKGAPPSTKGAPSSAKGLPPSGTRGPPPPKGPPPSAKGPPSSSKGAPSSKEGPPRSTQGAPPSAKGPPASPKGPPPPLATSHKVSAGAPKGMAPKGPPPSAGSKPPPKTP
ncbi:hypothetical protein Efla_005821 [Eimeria flavescens]